MITTEEMYKTLRPKRTKKSIIMTAVIILLIISAVLYYVFRDKGPAYIYTTEKVHTGNVASLVSATGTISATNEVLIGSEVSGTISAVFVEENDEVKKGDILAIINPDTINQNIAKYEAQLNSARATLNSSKVQYNNKKVNYDRLKQVYDVTGGKSPSKTDLDNAEMELNTAKADVLVKEASILEVETNLNSAKIDLKNSIITSPIDGVVLTRSIDAGQTVAASFSTPELFVIAENLEKMKLVVNVSEADVGKVKENQKVRFTVDTFPDDEFVSTIYRVNKGSTESDDNIVSYETTIYIDNKDLKLRSGMSATADIETDSAENAMLIPVAALFFQPIVEDTSEAGKRPAMLQGPPGRRPKAASHVNTDVSKNAEVYVLVNGAPEIRHIVTGVSDGKNVQVLEGLTSDDNIITSMKRRI
ncbi:MAG: efflux RND transporter periplasmic adaptor subunit [Mucispirillum sp.]|nr:efflux RND transporter periplasmic adaptor subunit [Mucispirillum sp.]